MVKSNRGAFPPPTIAQPRCVWEPRGPPDELKCSFCYTVFEDDFQLETNFSPTATNSNFTYSLYEFVGEVAYFIYPCITWPDLQDKRAKEKQIRQQQRFS